MSNPAGLDQSARFDRRRARLDDLADLIQDNKDRRATRVSILPIESIPA